MEERVGSPLSAGGPARPSFELAIESGDLALFLAFDLALFPALFLPKLLEEIPPPLLPELGFAGGGLVGEAGPEFLEVEPGLGRRLAGGEGVVPVSSPTDRGIDLDPVDDPAERGVESGA